MPSRKSELVLSETLDNKLKSVSGCENIESLRQMLREQMAINLEAVITTAAIIKRLEELGDDLAWFENELLTLYRMIAHGQVIPELVITLQGNPAMLEKAITLPIPDQQNLASNKPIKLVRLDGDHWMITPSKLSAREIKQLFCRGRMRDEGEQRRYLEERAEAAAAKEARARSNDVVINKKRRMVIVGGVELSAKDLARLLEDISG